MGQQRKILVVGASGITGRFAIEHLRKRPGIRLLGVARHRPIDATIDFVTTDLLDAPRSRTAFNAHPDITDVVFAAFAPADAPDEQVRLNRALVANTLAALTDAACRPNRLVLIQGMKRYGSNLGPFRTPAKESDPRLAQAHYYDVQEDLIIEYCEKSAAQWVCLRPHVILGQSPRATQNLVTLVGVYGALCVAQGKPLSFPGTAGAFEAVNQATDANLLAKAIAWSLDSPNAAGQAFNVTNGDFFRWQHLWPQVAAHFGIAPGNVQTQALGETMASQAGTWHALAQQHGLREASLERLVHWPFGDYILRTAWDVMASTIKIRQAGFNHCLDTEANFIDWLARLERDKILPPRQRS